MSKRIKKRIAEIVANPENNPILTDTNIFSMSHPNIIEILYENRLGEGNPRELKDARLYSSFLLTIIRENEKIITVPEVLPEINELIRLIINKKRRYDEKLEFRISDALRVKTRSKYTISPSFQTSLGDIKEALSNLEQALTEMRKRTREYTGSNGDYCHIQNIVSSAAEDALRRCAVKKPLSKADIQLVSAAIYEVMGNDKNPFILSDDCHIARLINFALYPKYFSPGDIEYIRPKIRLCRGEKDAPVFVTADD